MKLLIVTYVPFGATPNSAPGETCTTVVIPGETRSICIRIVEAMAAFEIEPEKSK